MITINELINGRENVIHFDEKKARLEELLATTIKPIEDMGYELSVVHGLLGNDEVGHIDDFRLRRDHIYGYGVDLTTGKAEDDKAIVELLNGDEIPCTSAKMYDGYFHVSYDKDAYETAEAFKMKNANQSAE